MKKLTDKQRKYIIHILQYIKSPMMKKILNRGWYTNEEANWLNNHSNIHTTGTKYEKAD